MRPQPSLFWRLRFAAWFAWQDLSESAAWPASFLLIITIALASAGSLVSVTVPIATHRVSLERLKANRLARCVWARDRSPARTFAKPDLDAFEARLREKLPHPELLSGCHAFSELTLDWYLASDKGSEQYQGRTLAEKDSLFRTMNQSKFLKLGAPFDSAERNGVIVTPALLDNLGYPEGTGVGTSLKIRTPHSGAKFELPIVAVTRDALPLGHLFLINDSQLVAIWTQDPDDLTKSIQTGLIHPDWPKDPDDLGDNVKRLFGPWQWQGFAATRNGKPCYEFEIVGNFELKRSQWKGYLKQLYNTIIEDRRWRPQEDFAVVHMVGSEFKAPPKLPAPRWASVYVEDLDAMESVVDVLKKDEWLTNENAVAQMKEISQSFTMTRLVLWGLMLLFCAAAAVSFYSAHSLCAKQKAAQIGMMRAIGMSDRMLRGIFLLQALMLWWRGTFWGLILGAVALAPLACVFLDAAEFTVVALDPWELTAISVFLLASLSGSLFTAWYSTRDLRLQPPVSSLALTS